MTIKYDVTEDDFWAGQEHLMLKAPEMKRYFRVTFLVTAALLLVLMPLLLLLTTPRVLLLPGMTGILCGGVVGLAFMALLLRYSTRLSRLVSRVFFRKVIDQATGLHELTILPRGLQIVTPHGEQVVYWQSIGNVAATPQHTFIYLTRMQSVIVPQRRVTSGNYHAFMQAFADIYAEQRDSALAEVATSSSAAAVSAKPPDITPAEPVVQQVGTSRT